MARNNEQLPPPEPDNDSDAWKVLEAELLGSKTSEDHEAAEHEMHTAEMKIRRREMLERIFEFSDLLVHAPPDFPDKRYLEHLASAADKILGNSLTRKSAVQSAVSELTAALKMMTSEEEVMERESDRAYEENQRRLRESRGGPKSAEKE